MSTSASQPETLQSRGQASGSHACTSTIDGHTAPSCIACVVTERVRLRVPPPHEREQLPQLAHSVVSQSTGQGPRLHLVWSNFDSS